MGMVRSVPEEPVREKPPSIFIHVASSQKIPVSRLFQIRFGLQRFAAM
jgi:hypothetical protein